MRARSDRVARARARESVAFSRADGKKVWETFAPDAPAERPHAKNGHASGTPATDGTRIYAYLGNHGLLALDMNGKEVWHKSLGAFDASHGTAGSPLLYKDRVIMFQDQRAAGGSWRRGAPDLPRQRSLSG